MTDIYGRILPDGYIPVPTAKRLSYKDRYHLYLLTPKWATLRQQVYDRCNGTCENCGEQPMQECHHLTYARVFRERLTDLLGVCGRCHEWIHGLAQ